MITIRSGGCGRVVGLILVLLGLILLLARENIIPSSVGKWWPVLVIALGLAMLVRHYWRLVTTRRPAPNVIDVPDGRHVLRQKRIRLRPPAGPVFVILVGIYLLLDNLQRLSWEIVFPALLILVGAVILFGSYRVSSRRV